MFDKICGTVINLITSCNSQRSRPVIQKTRQEVWKLFSFIDELYKFAIRPLLCLNGSSIKPLHFTSIFVFENHFRLVLSFVIFCKYLIEKIITMDFYMSLRARQKYSARKKTVSCIGTLISNWNKVLK